MLPDLDPLPPVVPRGGQDLGDGYILLRAKDRVLTAMRDCEIQGFASYLKDTHAIQVAENWSPGVCKWARVRLPNGQVARSSWKEKLKLLTKVRTARNIKV